jgi:hypothetical protein
MRPGLDAGIASNTLDTYESKNALNWNLRSMRESATLPKADIHCGGAMLPVAASTTIVPVICGCREQKYL